MPDSDFVGTTEIDTQDVNHLGTQRFQSDKFSLVDASDATKVMDFDLSGISSGATSTFTVPDVDGTYVTLAATQTLTSKTLTAPIINNAATLSVDDDNFTITESGDQTAILAFQTSGITTATTRTLTAQDQDGTIGLTGKSRTVLYSGIGKVGAGAGWAVGAAANTGYSGTVAASQTAGTFVMQVPYIGVGDTITGFYPIAQIESGGNTVTIDADLRTHVNVLTDPTDASVGAITQISKSADYAVGIADIKSGLSHTVLATNSYYILFTVTTGASCDVILLGCAIVFTDTSGS